MPEAYTIPKEGDHYKTLHIGGYDFELRYGFYVETDRLNSDPVILFPDLETQPIYTADGRPVVTCIQSPCVHYIPRKADRREDWCADCIHYPFLYDEIAICHCRERRRPPTDDMVQNRSEACIT